MCMYKCVLYSISIRIQEEELIAIANDCDFGLGANVYGPPYIYGYIWIYIHMYTYMHIHVCVCISIHMYIYIHSFMYPCLYITYPFVYRMKN